MAKPTTFCGCEDPVTLGDLVPEPTCQSCRHPVRRQPPGPIQDPAPDCAWNGPGPAPRPPETATAAYARGLAAATAGPLPTSAALAPPPAPAAPVPGARDLSAVRRALSAVRPPPPKESTP